LNRASEVTVINAEERREEEVAEKRGEDFNTESTEGTEKRREKREESFYLEEGKGVGWIGRAVRWWRVFCFWVFPVLLCVVGAGGLSRGVRRAHGRPEEGTREKWDGVRLSGLAFMLFEHT